MEKLTGFLYSTLTVHNLGPEKFAITNSASPGEIDPSEARLILISFILGFLVGCVNQSCFSQKHLAKDHGTRVSGDFLNYFIFPGGAAFLAVVSSLIK